METINLEYEIQSGCGARKKITAKSLRSAKTKATQLGFGTCFSVWIRDSKGKLLCRKIARHNAVWE